jgi:hypothetical protein
VLAQGRRDVGLQGEARGGGVEPRVDDPDDSGLLEVPDPVQGRGGGQADRPGQLHVGHIGIRLEQREQVNGNFIKHNSHNTEQ